MNNYSIFMEAISGLGLTSPQMEALSNLYKISANRPKINGENLGDIINYINERMDDYLDYIVNDYVYKCKKNVSKINRKVKQKH